MTLPKHLGMTERQFKQRKRREFVALLKAARALRYGCAYMPGVQIGALVDEIEAKYTQLKSWWKDA